MTRLETRTKELISYASTFVFKTKMRSESNINHVNLALVIQRQHEGVQITHVCV